jgi:hypothetical protein
MVKNVTCVTSSTISVGGYCFTENIMNLTFSIINCISRVAGGTFTVSSPGSAVVINLFADTIITENPSEWAFEAFLVVPVPFVASKVGWASNFRGDTGTILNFVSFVAGCAFSIISPGSAVVADGCADTFSVESPSVWAFKTFLVVPVPFLASKVGWAFNFRGDTGTIFNFVSFVAGCAFSIISPGSAVVADGCADTFSVENPSEWAFEAFLVVPVPFLASEVGWASHFWQNASSILDFVTFVASSAFSIISPGSAVVTDGCADTFSVESPSVWAFKTFLVVPVPFLASKVGWAFNFRGDTGTIFNFVSFVAGCAFSIISPGSAVVADGCADTFSVENPSEWAFEAFLVVPVPFLASEVGWASHFWQNASSILDFVTFVASSASSIVTPSGAVVTDGCANSSGVESPSVWAFKTFLVVPVPFLASKVGWAFNFRGDTGTILNFVSFVAGCAFSIISPGSAVVADGCADTFSVENPSEWAFEAFLVVPVPFLASEVGWASHFWQNASSILDFVTFVASSASSIVTPSGAVVTDGCANSSGVESPSVWAFKTFLVVPVPFLASKVGWAFNFRGDTGTILNFVSFVAGCAFSIISPGSAVVADGCADTFSVENPSEWAFKTFLVVPVPFLASKVGWASNFRGDTGTIFNFVSFVAGCAFSIISPGSAVVADGCADTFSVENPSEWAFEAFLVVPVPFLASEVGWASHFWQNASSILDFVTFVASSASSIVTPSGAVVTDGCANSSGVESPSVWAFKTFLVVPVPFLASKVGWAFNFRGDTGTILNFVSFVAGCAFSIISPGSAVVADGCADTFSVENPSEWAFKAFLSIPIPCFTSKVGWAFNFRGDTGTILNFVSFVAGCAFSIISPGSAVVADGCADTFSVENPSEWAFEAFLVVPVPFLASEVGWASHFWQNASSILDFVTFVASSASSIVTPSGAVVTDGCANSSGVESPSVWAFKTFLVVPVPFLASKVGWAFNFRGDTGTILNFVSFVAGCAFSIISPGSAVVADGCADTFSVENPSEWAFKTFLVVPVPFLASKVGWASNFRGDTGTIFNFVSFVAGCAFSIISPGSAVVADGCADTFSVENPSEWAFEAFLVVPVPFLASEVGWASHFWQNASSILDFVTFETCCAFSVGSPSGAVVTDLFTNAIITENPSEWAFKTFLVVPVPFLASYIGWTFNIS